MKDVKCGLRMCKHNRAYCCMAKDIMVTKKTDCAAFSPEPKNLTLFEAGDDFVTASYSVDTKVGCDAPCVFNRDRKCVANGITVMSENDSAAACLTFIKS